MLGLKNTLLQTTTAICLSLICYTVQAKPTMTIVCEEPNGIRTDFYQGEFREDQDGFAGVKPKFIFDNKKPQYATGLFEPAELAKKMGFKKTTNQFKIILQNTDQITLSSVTDNNTALMYTLFPKQGVGYFSIHRYNPIKTGEATYGSLKANCKVLANSSKK